MRTFILLAIHNCLVYSVAICFICSFQISFVCSAQIYFICRVNFFFVVHFFHPSAKIYFENRLVCDMFLFYLVSSILYAINILVTALSLKLNALISTSLFIF